MHIKRFITTALLFALIFDTAFTGPVFQSAVPIFSEATLSTPVVSGSLCDVERQDRDLLAAFVLQVVLKEPGIVSSGKRVASMIRGREIEACFGAPLSPGQAAPQDGAIDIFIKCSVDGRIYFVHLFRAGDGRTRMDVFSEAEYSAKDGGAAGRTVSGAEVAADIGLDSITGTVRVVDNSDDSVRIVSGFLQAVGALRLRDSFNRMVSEGKLLFYEGPLIVSEGLVVDTNADAKERAGFILSMLLAEAGVGSADLKGFKEALLRFTEMPRQGADAPGFDFDAAYPALAVALRIAEGGSGASNEGALPIQPDKYFMGSLNLGSVSIEDCRSVVEDIKRVFEAVARHDADERGGPDAAKREGIFRRLKPVDIEVVCLSESPVPSCIKHQDTDGIHVALNENFVKVMHVLKNRLNGDGGRISRLHLLGMALSEKGTMGDFYESILYSMAIHELRGHTRITPEGVVEALADERVAQGIRGRSHLYVNVLATLFYWFVIVENVQYPDQRVRIFLDRYPEMFSLLTPVQKRDLPGHIGLLAGRFREGERRPPGSAANSPRIIPGYLSPVFVFQKLFIENNPLTPDEMQRIWHYKPPEKLKAALSILRGLELVEEIGDELAGSAGANKRYAVPRDVKAIPRAIVRINDLLHFDGFNADVEAAGNYDVGKLLRIRAMILKLKEPWWAVALKTTFDAVAPGIAGNDAATLRSKILLAVDSDWVPDEQRGGVNLVLQEIDRLTRGGAIEVIRKMPDESKEAFAARVLEKQRQENIAARDVVVVGSAETVKSAAFSALKAPSGPDKTAAFFAVIDPRELTSNSYIGIVEILTMALRMAYMRPAVSTTHPYINIEKGTDRFVIFVPKTRPADIQLLPDVYKALIAPLNNA